MLKMLKKKTKRKPAKRKTAKRKTARRTKATPAQMRARKKFAAAARKAGGKVRKGARLK